MASQPDTVDLAQLRSTVAWLEEQRKLDRDEIGRLTSEVERLAAVLRDQSAHAADLRSQVDAGRSTVERIPLLDDSVRHAREQLAHLLERLDDHDQRVSHALSLRAADAERDRRQLTELAQIAARLEREDQALGARLSAQVEESRRDRARLAELPSLLGEVETRLGAAVQRLTQAEDMLRRSEALTAAFRGEIEAVRTEHAKISHWQQLADLRWSRHLAEWQQTVDNWRQTAEDQARPTQHLTTHVGQLRDELRAAQGALAEHQRRADDLGASIQRLDGGLAQQREQIARLEQALDGQRRRFDEQASAQLRLDESIGRISDQAQQFEHSLTEHSAGLTDIRAAMRTAEAAATQLREELLSRHGGLREELAALRTSSDDAVTSVRDGLKHVDGLLREVERLAQEHRQRLAVELENQARELAELATRGRR